MSRPNKFEVFMKMAVELSTLGTCARRKVGCILLDHNFRIVGSGYNGNAKTLSHCIDSVCAGATLPSGTGLDVCEAIHAEQNALMQCKNIDTIHIAVCTTFPCMHCMKMLMNTSCNIIAWHDEYTDMQNTVRIWTNSRNAQNPLVKRKIEKVNI